MIEKAKEDYLNGMKYKDIAGKYAVTINTVKSWVTRHGWAKLKKGAHKDGKSAHKKGCTDRGKTQAEKDAEKATRVVIENGKLTDKQQLFCVYYIESFNATSAYQKAYDCDRETARRSGSRLLTNVDIKSEIDRLTQECLNEKEINSKLISKRLLQKYIDIAFADITDFTEFGIEDVPIMDKNTGRQLIDENGDLVFYQRNYINFKNDHEVDGTLISEISQGKDGVKVKLQDKMKALDFLAKNIGLLSEMDKAKINTEKSKVKKLQIEIDKLGKDSDTPINIVIARKGEQQ